MFEDVTEVSTKPLFQLGGLFETVTGELFRYVKNGGSAALTVAKVCYFADTSTEYAEAFVQAATKDNLVAGVPETEIGAGLYGFVKVRGITQVTAAAATADVAVGEAFAPSGDGATGGLVIPAIAGKFVIGHAVTAITATAGTAYLNIV